MNEGELLERIKNLANLLSDEANKHAHLREIAEDEASRTYHLGYMEALRVVADRISVIISEYYRI